VSNSNTIALIVSLVIGLVGSGGFIGLYGHMQGRISKLEDKVTELIADKERQSAHHTRERSDLESYVIVLKAYILKLFQMLNAAGIEAGDIPDIPSKELTNYAA